MGHRSPSMAYVQQGDISGWEEEKKQKTRITLDDVVVESEVIE